MTWADPRTGQRCDHPLEVLGDIYDAIDEDEGFGVALLEIVGRLVPSDLSTFNLTELSSQRTVFDSWPAPHPVHRRRIDDFVRLQAEHPLVAHFSAIDEPPPTRWCDVVDPAAFQRSELYAVYYRPMRVRHQLALKVGGRGSTMASIALSRSRRGFSDDECDRVARILPHLRRARRLVECLHVARRGGAQAGFEPSLSALVGCGLTRRQAEVAVELCRGGTNTQVAARLGLRTGTLRKHLERIFTVFEVDNRTAAVAAVRLVSATPASVVGGQRDPDELR